MGKVTLNDHIFTYSGLLSAGRSKDKRRQVGSLVVWSDRISGIGYNGTPPNVSDDDFPWDSADKDPVVFHAEFNAYLNALKTGHVDELLGGATLYTPFRPCTDCSRLALGYQISRIVFMAETKKPHWVEGSRLLLEKYGDVELEKINLDIEPLIKKLTTWFGTGALEITTPHIERAYGKRENYLSWDEYFSGLGQLLTIRPDIDFATVVVNEDNYVGKVLYNDEILTRDIARSKAYATAFPEGKTIDMLRNRGVDNLHITYQEGTSEMYKGMSINFLSNEKRQAMVHRIAHELAHQYYQYTGKDFIV